MRITLSVLALVLCCSTARAQDYVWWEGENPVETNFPKNSWFAAGTFADRRDLLSGGDWLSNSGKRGRDEAFARYLVDVPADGKYQLWTRKFYKHGPFRWRFGDAPWQICGKNIALADNTELRTHVCANWVFLGEVSLKKGQVPFEIRLAAAEGEELTSAFDCFVLSRGPFVPNGKVKPGQRTGLADEGFFAWEPPVDRFGDDALLDLRSLNERVAGEKGFVRRDGERFVLGSGKPARFWAVNIGKNNIAQDRASIDYMARRLAKLGVNMVRFHGALFSLEKPASSEDLDNLFYAVSALKREGIYTTISVYFPLWFAVTPATGIQGYVGGGNVKPFAILYFDARLQDIYRSRMKRILDTPNPYTKLTLARDPAVAIVEVVNEDSLFFWTFNQRNVPSMQWQKLERMYAAWLARQYGSADKAIENWGGRDGKDDPAGGRMAVLDAWHMTRDGLKKGGPAKQKRMSDQVRFLAEVQRDFYASTRQYMKDTLRVGGLVLASNWTTADPSVLDAVERFTYTATDVIDRHGYFGGKHEGEASDYSVRVGHKYQDLAGVLTPEKLPIATQQVADYPQVISELGWTNPNRFRAEATFLTSAYGALSGLDGVYWFALGSNYVTDASINKFSVASPVTAGTFPATALQFRRGDVKEAEPAVHQVIDLQTLYSLASTGASPQAMDELRKRDIPADGKVSGPVSAFDPMAFYIGRVVRAFDNDPGRSFQRDLRPFTPQAKTVRSLTGELTWNYDIGLVKQDTPRSQGAAGFLAKGAKIDLADVTIESSNEYGAILVIALDDAPLAESRNILIQAFTEERPRGFRTNGDTIADLGSAPFGVRKINMTVTLRLKGSGDVKATALDENGYATDKRVSTNGDGVKQPLVLRLPEDAVYTIVRR